MCICAVFFVIRCIVWVSPWESWRRTHVQSLESHLKRCSESVYCRCLYRLQQCDRTTTCLFNSYKCRTRMNRKLNRSMRIACKENLPHMYVSSYNKMHMYAFFCFSASLFIMIKMDFSQMFWKNDCSSKACFLIKQLLHTCISWSHQKSGVWKQWSFRPWITCHYLCQVFFEPVIKNQTAYQAWCCLFPLLLYTHKILDIHKAYLKHTYITLVCIFGTLCWNMLLWARLSWLSNCLCLSWCRITGLSLVI